MNYQTQVGIIGVGSAGLTLALLLDKAGVSSIILRNRGREYVESHERAWLLEHNTVSLLDSLSSCVEEQELVPKQIFEFVLRTNYTKRA
jgi:2-polyprenyl-6-methoxyphenol hydroxylase-like FAD-dependent oxidoreductase